jgi:secreted trypsin-like serine protease
MSASLSDILTTQKNGVVAINNLAQATSRGLGTQTSATITGQTLIFNGPGYLVGFSVLVAGSTAGTISNTNAVSTVAASNALCTIPAAVGITKVGQVFSTGLVITPGTGQSINVTYSPG